MKPNEYKAYRKIEAEIIKYLDCETLEQDSFQRVELNIAVSNILERTLSDRDLQALDQMIEDEKTEGTIDFSNLEKYGLYREPAGNTPQSSMSGHWGEVPSFNDDKDLFAALTGGQSTACQNVGNELTEQTLSMIRRQLADITYIEHYLQDMKKELIEMTEKLNGAFLNDGKL